MSDGNGGGMRPDIDMGPCSVKGPLSALRTRVMWQDGVLYVVRSLQDVVSLLCPAMPRQEGGAARPYLAHTDTGVVRFRRAGCTCSYRLGTTNGFALMDRAVPLTTPASG